MLLMEKDKDLEIFYAPFDYINDKAKVVIIGITPGLQQAQNALRKIFLELKAGKDPKTALKMAKETGSFSGSMRNNLIKMLDFVKLSQYLKIDSCFDLFEGQSDLVHYTSFLRYPVFKGKKNYNGVPDPLKNDLLKHCLKEYFMNEVKMLKQAVFIPLGSKVESVFDWLESLEIVDGRRVLRGLPHPSGANAERVAYFLEEKSKKMLSRKTNPDKIDLSKQKIFDQMKGLF